MNLLQHNRKQVLLVATILCTGLLVAGVTYAFRPTMQRLAVEVKIPVVTVLAATPSTQTISVHTRGTVLPRTEINLSAEVSGQIIEVSRHFVNGGFFHKDDILLKTNPLEYQLAIHRAQAKVASAKQQLANVNANAKQALANLKSIGKGVKNATAYARYVPQLEEADANLKASKAELELAQLNLQRTEIIAPFNGRVHKKQVDKGDYLTPGKTVAEIYAVDVAEIRLPLSDRQLILLDKSWLYQSTDQTQGASVKISARFLGEYYHWDARIVRSEGMIDQKDRLVYLVAQVQSPYSKDPQYPNRPPLAFGLFVEAVIEGKPFDNVVELPRGALRNNNYVWVASSDNTLQIRKVSVLHKDLQRIYIKSGLNSGDRVIVSPLDIISEGMSVRVQKATTKAQG